MSEADPYWFHCGSCGRLFSEGDNFSDDRNCPLCGESPTPLKYVAPPVQDANTDQTPLVLEQQQQGRPRGGSRLRMGYKVVLAWLVLMGVVFAVAHWMRDSGRVADSGDGAPHSTDDSGGLSGSDREFADAALPVCTGVLEAYFEASDIESRLPLVLPHSAIRSRMEEYYADSKPLSIQAESLTLKARTLVDLPEGRTLLTQWESSDGASFDAAFRQSAGEWRLDWHHFVRYSDLSWPLFLAGQGVNDVAEFRLHARQRLAREDDPANGIGVVLSAPLRRQIKVEGFSQSMRGLSLDEDDGKLLEKAFALEADKEPIFGAGMRDLNPEAMIRVRVRVQRIGEEGGNTYRIVKVLACHWYESAATGVE